MRNQKWLPSLIILTIFQIAQCYRVNKYTLTMPNVHPDVPELYLCTPIKMDRSNNYYIVGFEPNATMNTAHHMILYACAEPGSSKPVWNCGSMSKTLKSTESAKPCKSGSQIIYAWARDAPKLILPEGVGFKVGGDTMLRYLVLQVHYAHIDRFKDDSTDDSGVFLHYTMAPMNKLAGLLVLATDGMIQPQSTEYMEVSCTIKENKTIYPFAYRTHTHALGKVVSGYVIDQNNEWKQLGKRDPLTPQMFYPVDSTEPIGYGDTLAARCTMHNFRDTPTYVGQTNDNEMCNFYLMYYVETGEPLKQKECVTRGPPTYYWQNDGLINIPDREASTL